MSSHHEFYLARAADARRDAATATLANVRDRHLRSEAAWSEMAARAGRADRERVKVLAEKAERNAGREAIEALSAAAE